MKLFLKIFALFFIVSSVVFFLFILLPFVILGGFILSLPAMFSNRGKRVEVFSFSSDAGDNMHGVKRHYSVLADVTDKNDEDVIDVKAKEIK